jgi:hypothetical protein
MLKLVLPPPPLTLPAPVPIIRYKEEWVPIPLPYYTIEGLHEDIILFDMVCSQRHKRVTKGSFPFMVDCLVGVGLKDPDHRVFASDTRHSFFAFTVVILLLFFTLDNTYAYHVLLAVAGLRRLHKAGQATHVWV